MGFCEIVPFSTLLNKTIIKIEGDEQDNEMFFSCSDGSKYKMYHDQNCCEDVYINDITGDLKDLIGNPILMADEATENTEPYDDDADSATWTFYKLATKRGYVTIRWYGQSNGYYSETADFEEVEPPSKNLFEEQE